MLTEEIPDCTAVQTFIERNPTPNLDLSLESVPRLVECLLTHQQIEYSPRINIPSENAFLRAFGLNLFGADLRESHHVDCRFRGCNLTDVKAFGASFLRVTFIGCYIHGADFAESEFIDCQFIGCEISKNDFREFIFSGSSFVECDIYGNWARGATGLAFISGDEFGFHDLPPWEMGICDGHEIITSD